MTESNRSQTPLKLLVIAQTIALLLYTALAIKNEGWGLFNIFVNNILSLHWNGQFNLDFSCYLLLSGLWIMWRNKFSISSILFALAAMIIGIMLFAPYLFYLITKEKGDLTKVLTGSR